MPVTTLFFSVSFVGTGSTGPFPFVFPISAANALEVVQDGSVLAPTAYIIAPINNNYENGGIVSLNDALPNGASLVLQRVTPLNQLDVFTDNMPVPLKTIEYALDKLTEIAQEQGGVIEPLSVPVPANWFLGGPTTGGAALPTFRPLPSGGGSGTSGVTSLNTLQGGLTLAVGAGLSISVSGTTLTISLATSFGISSFTGGRSVEVGAAVVNPVFGASYTATPDSANITNTENIDSPLTLTTPFTTGTVVGTFVHTTPVTTTFTLHATKGTTLTATQAITWAYSIFGGVGTAGATSSVTASGTTAVLSTSDVLARAQIGAETVGETFGPYTTSGQVIYLLLTGSAHTFTDANTGFPMAFNAPITVAFVNANGASVTMYLYQTTYPLFGTSTPRVAS